MHEENVKKHKEKLMPWFIFLQNNTADLVDVRKQEGEGLSERRVAAFRWGVDGGDGVV